MCWLRQKYLHEPSHIKHSKSQGVAAMSTSSDREQADFKGQFSKEWEKARKEIKKVSILVMGGSGTGKSSLVNTVFKKEIAKVGAGKPVTRGIELFENDYLRVYDSEGYESGEENQKAYNRLIENFLEEKAVAVDTDVHLIWYCVSTPSARFTDLDVMLIKKTERDYKKSLAVVLTKIDIGTEKQFTDLTMAIKDLCPGISIFASSTEDVHLEKNPGDPGD
ncbi:MAG: 50S ribosome-binding GTPase, partial [Deltaproteobacteria bacterium]|nr:50S ribosome-binding GTPase [Deltaproteobacteria bacterium]